MKKILAGLLFMASLVLFLPPAADAQIQTISIAVGTSRLAEQGIVNKGIVYVPVRPVVTEMGVSWEWDPARKRLVINGKTVSGNAIRYNNSIYLPYTAIASFAGVPAVFDGSASRVIFRPEATEDTLASYLGGTSASLKPSVSSSSPAVSVQAPSQGFIKEPFVPVVGENDVFKVSVTNMDSVSEVKGQRPRSGNKFVAVHLSQQNVSREVQIYTGKFALMDKSHRIYEYSEGVSNFWLVVLRPGGTNFGYLVFEVPVNSEPNRLILSTTSRPPMTINLSR